MESGSAPASRGPHILLTAEEGRAMDGKYTIGVDAGGTKVAYCLFDQSGKPVDRLQHRTDTDADGVAFSDTVISVIERMLGKNGLSARDLNGIGIVMPSFLLFDRGYVCMTSAMTNICEFPMRDYIAQRINTKFVLDNDSNVAALAEHRYGAGRGARHMVYVSVSTGLGCGIVINGSVFRGSYGWAGECGHMLITPDEGLACGCRNRGCFMSYASGRYIVEHVKNRLARGDMSVLSQADVSGETIMAACHAGDAVAKDALRQFSHYLAVCVFNIYQLLNINLFVFGGGLTNCGEALFGAMREEFDRYNHVAQPVEFRFAQLGRDTGVIGAAELVKETDIV